jgi:hypothetical protein
VVCAEAPYILVVEPWAMEYAILPGDKCMLVVNHVLESARFSVENHKDARLSVWVNLSGATYEFWRNGKIENEMLFPNM